MAERQEELKMSRKQQTTYLEIYWNGLAEILSGDQIVEEGMRSRVEEAMGNRTRVVALAVATLQALGITDRQPQDLVDAHVLRMRPNGFGDLFEFRSGNSGARMGPTGQPCPGSFTESPDPNAGQRLQNPPPAEQG
jgi:hypothetical protein